MATPWAGEVAPGQAGWEQGNLSLSTTAATSGQLKVIRNCTLGPMFHSHEVTSAGRAAGRSGRVLLLHLPELAGASPVVSSSKEWPGSTRTRLEKRHFASESRGVSTKGWEQREGKLGSRAGTALGAAAQPGAGTGHSRAEAAAQGSAIPCMWLWQLAHLSECSPLAKPPADMKTPPHVKRE